MYAWVCKKCYMLIYSSRSPNASSCPCGGSHMWIRTGKI